MFHPGPFKCKNHKVKVKLFKRLECCHGWKYLGLVSIQASGSNEKRTSSSSASSCSGFGESEARREPSKGVMLHFIVFWEFYFIIICHHDIVGCMQTGNYFCVPLAFLIITFSKAFLLCGKAFGHSVNVFSSRPGARHKGGGSRGSAAFYMGTILNRFRIYVQTF